MPSRRRGEEPVDKHKRSIPDGEFSPEERRELRRILETQARTEWLWATLRIWAIWIAAVVGGIYALLAILRDGLRSLIGGGN